MKIFKSTGGLLAAKVDEVTYFTNLGGDYISPRFILPSQGSPLETDDWSIYLDANHSLIGCPARLENGTLIIESPHGDLRFIPENSANSAKSATGENPRGELCASCRDIRFVRADASWLSIERTPHCYARFVDFSKRFPSCTDTSRTIY